MLEKVQESSHPFNPYYKDNTLLIQLMLTEVFRIHAMIEQLKTNNFAGTLSELVGDMSPLGHTSYSNRIKGTLNRLKQYIAHFYLNTKTEISNLNEGVNKAWLNGIESQLLINELQVCQNQQKKETLLLRQERKIKSLISRLHKIFKEIFNLLILFENHENVASFLMRKKSQLINVFGNKPINQLFKRYLIRNANPELSPC